LGALAVRYGLLYFSYGALVGSHGLSGVTLRTLIVSIWFIAIGELIGLVALCFSLCFVVEV
jgi:hypothetical protein